MDDRDARRGKFDRVKSFARWSAPLVALAVIASPALACAQDATALAARRELIEQSQRDRTTGNHAGALELAARAGRIQMTPSLRLFIAQEHNSLGQLAQAYGEASRCAVDADTDTALANRATIVASCRALATTLHDRIGRLTIAVASPPPGLAVSIDGRHLDDSLLDVPYPVTPGTIVITAEAPGYAPFRREIPVATNESLDVRVELQRLPPASTPVVPAEPVPAARPAASVDANASAARPIGETHTTSEAGVAVPRDAARPQSQSSSRSWRGPWVLGGGGVIFLAVSGVLFGAHQRALEECMGIYCPSQADINLVYATSTGALITLGIGVIALGGGLVWGFTRATPPSTQPAGRASAWVVPMRDGLVVGLGGSF